MKTLAAFALVLVALAPAVTAQTAPDFTGKWEGTFTIQRPDGTEGDPRPVVFNLTQKGKDLTGTGGPANQQWKIEKGEVAAGKATFEMQQPEGPLFKFALTAVLTGVFSLVEATMTFAAIVVSETLWGFFVGWLMLRLRYWADEPRIEVTLSFCAPLPVRTGELPEDMAARARNVIARALDEMRSTDAGLRSQLSPPRPNTVLPTSRVA